MNKKAQFGMGMGGGLIYIIILVFGIILGIVAMAWLANKGIIDPSVIPVGL